MLNWLQVLVLTKVSDIDQCVGHELEAQMSPLDMLKADQQAFEFVLPCEGSFYTLA
ncbi:hypothetical protein [Magnetofaba australis]|uniref:hypothetical protein n=1 Tax=Magnetofaba australis TaxID=1472297 RepID=UPI001301E62A|nr:hypothetical protein [Magnetofaba australis]